MYNINRGGGARRGQTPGRGGRTQPQPSDQAGKKPVPKGAPAQQKALAQTQSKPLTSVSAQSDGPASKPVTPIGSPGADKLPTGLGFKQTGPSRAQTTVQDKAAGQSSVPTHDTKPQGSAVHEDWELKGFKQDVDRLIKESTPNQTDEITAVCRVLNDCNKHTEVLASLFQGHRGDPQLVRDARQGIKLALMRANQHLESKSSSILNAGSICQLFNGIRGFLACDPFQKTLEQQHVREQLARLARNLLLAIKSNSAILKQTTGPKLLLPYSQILLGLLRIHQEGLITLSSHKEALQMLLDGIAGSGSSEGWDIQGISNSLLALGNLLHGQPPALDADHAAVAAHTLVELMNDSLLDSKERRLWNELDCKQARQGVRCLLDAKVKIDDPNAALDNLQAVEEHEPIQPTITVSVPVTSGHPTAPKKPAVKPQQEPKAETKKPTQVQVQPDDPKAKKAAPGQKPAPDKPVAQRARTTTQAPRHSQQQSDALQHLRAQTTPRALFKEIRRLEQDAADLLQLADVKDLCQWLTLSASTGRQTTVAEQAVQGLANAAQHRAGAKPAPGIEDSASLLLALNCALAKFPECAADLKPAMHTVCAVLNTTPIEKMKLGLVCDVARSLAPLIADGDERAAQALEKMTQASKGYGATLQSEGFQFSSLGEMMKALMPVLDDVNVSSLLKTLTDRLGRDSTLPKLSKSARSLALAEIVANAANGTTAAALLVNLMTALARGLNRPAMQAKDIEVTQDRWRCVYSLLSSSWITDDKGTPTIRSLGDDSTSDSLASAFICGSLQDSKDTGKQKAIAVEHKEHLVGLAQLEVAQLLTLDISDVSESSYFSLRESVFAIETATPWLARAGIADWKAIQANAILTTVDALMHLDESVVRQLIGKLPEPAKQSLLNQLRAAEYCLSSGILEVTDERTAQRNRASALQILISGTDLPKWSESVPSGDIIASFLKQFDAFSSFKVGGGCLYRAADDAYEFLGVPTGLQTYLVIAPSEMKRCLDSGSQPQMLRVFSAPWIPPGGPYHEAQELSFCGPHTLNNLNFRLTGDPNLLVTKPILDAFFGTDAPLYSGEQLVEFNNAHEGQGFPRLAHVNARLTDAGTVEILNDLPSENELPEAFGVLFDHHHTFPSNGIGKHITSIERALDGNYAVRDSRPQGQVGVKPLALGSPVVKEAIGNAIAGTGVLSWLRSVANDLAQAFIKNSDFDPLEILSQAHIAARDSQAPEFLSDPMGVYTWMLTQTERHDASTLADRFYTKLLEELPDGARGVSILYPESSDAKPAQPFGLPSGPDVKPPPTDDPSKIIPPADTTPLPKNLSDSLESVKTLIANKNWPALQRVADALPNLPLGNFDFTKFNDIIALLPSALGEPAGHAIVQAFARRFSELVKQLGPPLTLSQAMRLLADIACTIFKTGKNANEAPRAYEAVYLLMDVIARQCSQKPATWGDGWWTKQGLTTVQGQGTFIFQILRASWKSTTEPNVYVLPVTASPQLIRMFIVGMKFREPAAETQTTTWIQFGATLDGTYLALIDMHERCRTNEDVKKLVVPSVDLILAVANTLNNKAGNAGEQVVLEGYKALIDAVQAWNDPQALVNSLPQKYKPWLANAAARALRVVQASSALASRIGQEHYDAIVALVAYCKGNITTTQSQRK